MRKALIYAVGCAISASGICATQSQPNIDRQIAQAKLLVDSYYGSGDGLEQAGRLISEVFHSTATPPVDAYVQAARIAGQGGHIINYEFVPGTLDIEQSYLQKALKLDPSNAAALSLEAELRMAQGNMAGAFDALQAGLKASPRNPWLHIHLGEYFWSKHDQRSAAREYLFVLNQPMDAHPEQRRAFPRAASNYMMTIADPSKLAEMRDLARRADTVRNPSDAWTLDALAQNFLFVGAFDDAIHFDRKALSIMNFGLARNDLARGLYGKAATLIKAGQTKQADALIAEAKDLSSDGPYDLIEWAASSAAPVQALTPIIGHMVGVEASIENQ